MSYGVSFILGLGIVLQELRGELGRVSKTALLVNEKMDTVCVGRQVSSGI